MFASINRILAGAGCSLLLFAHPTIARDLEYKNARVVLDALPKDSIANLANQVGAIRLLRGSDDGGRSNHQRGESTVTAEDLQRLLHAIGDRRLVHTPMKVKSTIVTGDTDPHMDAKLNGDEFEDEEEILIMFLNSNPGATFQVGEDKIPVEAGTLVKFKGNSVLHNTVMPSGTEVHILGPISSRSLEYVGDPTTAPTGSPVTPPPSCQNDVVCNPGVCFDAVKPDACPSDHYLGHEYFFHVYHGCDSTVPEGHLCEADGECSTDDHLNNCGFHLFHGYSIPLDVYRRVECCDD